MATRAAAVAAAVATRAVAAVAAVAAVRSTAGIATTAGGTRGETTIVATVTGAIEIVRYLHSICTPRAARTAMVERSPHFAFSACSVSHADLPAFRAFAGRDDRDRSRDRDRRDDRDRRRDDDRDRRDRDRALFALAHSHCAHEYGSGSVRALPSLFAAAL